MIEKFKKLSTAKKIGTITASIFALALITPASDSSNKTSQDSNNQQQQTLQAVDTKEIEPIVVRETKNELKKESIPFESTSKNDSSIETGKTVTSVKGVNGEKTITYEVIYEDNIEVSRKATSEVISISPVNELILIGTKQPVKYIAPAPQARQNSNCDSNYSGCVPIASDVDCSGGSGNGPAYVSGPVSVLGSDIYGLDRDNDGIGCE